MVINPYSSSIRPAPSVAIPLLQSRIQIPQPISNEPWGDDITHKHHSTFRLFYQNANGLIADNHFHDSFRWTSKILEYSIDSLGLSETNIAWTLFGARSQFANRLRHGWDSTQVRIQTSHSQLTPSRTLYQPGGTAQVVGGRWTSRVVSQQADPSGMGRWSSITIQGTQGTLLHIITAYQVTSNSTGPTTAATQQRSLLAASQRSETDPRKAMETDLIEYITTLPPPNNFIILQIDANASLHTRQSWLHRLVNSTSLIDIHGLRHTLPDDLATYNRGSSRIDYVFISSNVLPFVDKCGILPFDGDSDHRGLWVDIHLLQLLRCSEPPPDLMSPPSRGVNSRHLKQATEYKQHLYSHLHANNLFKNFESFHEQYRSRQLTPSHIRKRLITFDNLITQAMLHAEKRVTRRWTTPWTPQLRSRKAVIQFWSSWITQHKTGRSMADFRSALLQRMLPTHRPPPTHPTNLDFCFTSQQQAVRDYRKLRLDADALREQFLLEQANLPSSNLNRRHRAITRIRKLESTRKLRRLVQRVLPKKRSGALTHIKIPPASGSPTDPWTVIRDPQEMTSKLRDRNLAHFGQANGTPFASAAIREWTRLPTSDIISHLLQHFSEDSTTTDVLQELATPLPNATPIHTTLRPQELIDGFRVWREDTSTSPSGRHLGLYKSILSGEDPTTLSSESSSPVPFPLTDTLFRIMTEILNIGVQETIILPRWQKIVNLMLQKLHDNPRIDKLRVIHLMEADINLWTGIVTGRRLLPAALQQDLIGPEQCGSIFHRSTLDVSGVRLFSMLISQLTCTDMGIFDNDAKACYDRIVMSLYYLRSSQIGLDSLGNRFMDEWLSTAKYFLKTHLGVSEEFYQSTIDHYLHGSGQGGRASPPIWVIVSALLFLCMAKRFNGATLTDPAELLSISHIMQAFVDDSTIWTNNFLSNLLGQQDPSEIANRLQTAAQYWERLLHVSGGKLELPKCFYYLVCWTFDREGRPLLRREGLPSSLAIFQSDNGQLTEIPRKDNSSPTRTLGITDTPLHQSSAPFNVARSKSNTIAHALRAFPVRPDAARLLYTTVYIPKMTFANNLASLTFNQCNKIQARMKEALLNCLGFSRFSPNAIVYAPVYAGGIGLQHLYYHQGAAQVHLFLSAIRQDNRLSQYLRIFLRWCQLVSGVGFPILQRPGIELPHLPGKYIQELRRFMDMSDVQLHLPDESVHRRQRKHDAFLMDLACDSGLPSADIQAINRVRLYLQVARISDIADPSGNHIFRINHRDDIPSQSTLRWPRQPRPGPQSWTTWRQFLASYVTRGTDSRVLQRDLGPWIASPSDRHWTTMYSPSDGLVYIASAPQSYAPFTATPERRLHNISPIPRPSTTIPRDSFPASRVSRTKVKLSSRISTPRPTQPRSWMRYVRGLPLWEQFLLQHVHMLSHYDEIISYFRSSRIYLVSDGGYNSARGGFGWALGTETAELIHGWGVATGNPLSSYRAELFGRLSGFRFLFHFLRFFAASSVQIDLHTFCDNQSVINNERSFQASTVPPSFYTSADSDLLLLLRSSLRNFSFSITSSHIRGHQDRFVEFSELNRPAQLNVVADTLATRGLHDTIPPFEFLPPVPLITCNERHITSHEITHLRHYAAIKTYNSYMKTKHDWDQKTFDTIHWSAFRKSFQRLPQHQQKFVCKLSHHWLPTAERLFRESRLPQPVCLRCNSPVENFTHVLRCEHPNASSWRAHFLHSLTQWLQRNETPPALAAEIFSNIDHWLSSSKSHLSSPQTQIGWDALYCGFITTSWCTSFPSDSTWHSDFITFIWEQVLEAWYIRNQTTDELQSTVIDKQHRQQATHTINTLYKLQDRCYYNDAFHEPLERLLKRPTRYLLNWVHSHERYILLSHKRYTQDNPLRQTTIDQYFATVRPPEV